MLKKIALIGSHGVGKTTLSYLLASKYKMEGRSVKIVQEVARSCPYPLNDKMSKEACLWIYHEHMKKELEASQKFDMVICDRSCIDSFMYARAQKVDMDDDISSCYRAACRWMGTYDKIIFVKSNSCLPKNDGFRSTDVDFQQRVEEEFGFFVRLHDNLPIQIVYSEDIFKYKDSLSGLN